MSDELKAYLYFDLLFIGAALLGYFVGKFL